MFKVIQGRSTSKQERNRQFSR